MASVPTTLTPAPFVSFKNSFAIRKAILDDWQNRFEREKTEVINGVAETIFKQIMDHLKQVTENPCYAIYTKAFPLKVDCPMQAYFPFLTAITKVSPILLKQLKEGTVLHNLLVKKSEETNAKNVETGSLKEKGNLEISFAYLNFAEAQTKLNEIGNSVEVLLKKKMKELKNRPGNNALEYTVTWFDRIKFPLETNAPRYDAPTGVYANAWFVENETAPIKSEETKKERNKVILK